jgi:hypothetical protein
MAVLYPENSEGAGEAAPGKCLRSRRLKALRPILNEGKYFSFATELVTKRGAFYNPSNTAMESVVSFTRRPGIQPPIKTVVFSVSECKSFDLHFSNSQEH